jgi:DNA-binding transcriptional regulator GbsR (MarR family)
MNNEYSDNKLKREQEEAERIRNEIKARVEAVNEAKAKEERSSNCANTMKEQLKSILGKHKVIGDTTYGLGYAEANQLTDEIIAKFVEVVRDNKRNYPICGDSADWRRGYTEALDDVLEDLAKKD